MSPTENLPAAQPFSGPQIKNGKISAFWSTPGTICIGKNLHLKRFQDEFDDSVHILRIDKNSNGKTFKFPSFFISTLILRMKEIWNKLEQGADQKWKLPGYDKVTEWNEMTSDEFWNGPDSIKIAQFRMKPYLSSYETMQFRIWNEIDKEFHRTFENEKGTVVWRGPVATITLDSFKKLLSALENINTGVSEN